MRKGEVDWVGRSPGCAVGLRCCGSWRILLTVAWPGWAVVVEKNQYDSGKTRLPQPSAVHVDAVTRRAFLSFAMQTLASLKVL